MAEVKSGDNVKVHYTGKFDDGTIFNSSAGRSPLEFTLGKGEMIAGFEAAVFGMKPGDSKSINIPADEAYGQRQDELLMEIERNQIPEGLNPEAGQPLQLKRADGQEITVMVTEIKDDVITLDANHPMAGKDLTFEIQLVEIV